jgi:hypothetical protein
MTEARWSRYRIRLTASTKPRDALRPVLAELQQELEARPHLDRPTVKWNDAGSGALVEVGTEDYDPTVAAESVREELVEAIPTVLKGFDEVAVDAIDSTPEMT